MTRSSLALAFVLLASVASAQSSAPDTAEDPHDAAHVAAWVQGFYERTSSLRMEFRQFAWTRDYDRTDASRGTLRIARPGRVRFDYAAPSGRIVLSDAGDVTSYEPVEGTAGQYWRGRSDAVSRALGILTGTTDIARDFTLSIREAAGGPAQTVCLQLIPRRPEAYARIWLSVAEPRGARGAILQMAIEDRGGNWNTFQFPARTTEIDVPLEAGTFDFEPPTGAREITPPSGR